MGPPALGAILITGAARRIGRQMALHLAQQGYDLALHYHRSEAEALALLKDVQALGRRAILVQADLAALRDGTDIIAQCWHALGGLHGLINNASLFEPDDILSLSPESWAVHHAVNLQAPVFLTQAFARRYLAGAPAARSGNIINIIDQRVLKPNPQFFSYTAAKAGLWAITRTLAQGLAPHIRVNAIGPGPTLANSRMTEEDFAQQAQLTLLERGTTPMEIAATVSFILSQPALTGQMIVLDGGQHLLWQTPDLLSVKE